MLLQQGAVNVEAYRYSEFLLQNARAQKNLIVNEVEPPVRSQGFRRAVVTAYEYRCALCGIGISTSDGHTVVEAAHIVPWSVSKNDDPRNGMALCKLCHWVFDEGLMAVSQRYKVIISKQLTSSHNFPSHLLTLTGREIIAPLEDLLWPSQDSLLWHQKNVFRRL